MTSSVWLVLFRYKQITINFGNLSEWFDSGNGHSALEYRLGTRFSVYFLSLNFWPGPIPQNPLTWRLVSQLLVLRSLWFIAWPKRTTLPRFEGLSYNIPEYSISSPTHVSWQIKQIGELLVYSPFRGCCRAIFGGLLRRAAVFHCNKRVRLVSMGKRKDTEKSFPRSNTKRPADPRLRSVDCNFI